MFLEQWIKNAEVGVAKRNQELIEFTANDVCTYHPGIAETSTLWLECERPKLGNTVRLTAVAIDGPLVLYELEIHGCKDLI